MKKLAGVATQIVYIIVGTTLLVPIVLLLVISIYSLSLAYALALFGEWLAPAGLAQVRKKDV